MRVFGGVARRVGLGVGMVVCVGLCLVVGVGSSATAGVSRGVHVANHGLFTAGRPGFSPTAREVAGSARRAGRSGRSGLPVRVGARLGWLSRATSSTFVAGSGRLVTRIYSVPVNYKTSRGSFAAIDDGLVATASGWRQRANDLGVRLPRSATQPARLSVAAGGLALRLAGSAGRGVTSGTVDRFMAARPGVDLAYRSQTTGIGWQASVSSAEAGRGLSWVVSPSSGLSAKLVADGVAFVNRAGRTVWLFTAPTAHVAGSRQPAATRLSVSRTAQGDVIHLALAGSRPAAAHRQFAVLDPEVQAPIAVPAAISEPDPIVYDGQIVPGAVQYLGGSEQTGDCYVDSTTPTTPLCGGDTDDVGPDDNMLVNFDIADNLPADVEILQAAVSLGLGSASDTTADNVGVWPAAQPWTSAATWNSYDGTHAWTTPGGTTTGAAADVEPVGASGDVGNDFYWDVAPIVQGWVDHNPAQVDGLIFKATDGSSAPNTLGFNSQTSTTGDQPYLSVYYQQRLGDYPDARYDTQQLTDRSNEGVNVANGNLLVSNTDLSLPGINGLNLTIGRYYNNLSDSQDSFGLGWSMGAGADTYLVSPCASNEIDDFDGTGDAQVFNATTGAAAPGVDMHLSMNATYAYNATQFTVLARHAGITETYTAPADACDKVARLSSIADRNGNTISYDYNSSGQLSSIVDSHAKTTTIGWSAAGYIDERAITECCGRR